MQKYCLLLLISFITLSAYSQEFTINGYIRAADNGEELIGVTVYSDSLSVGTTTNQYGFYSLTLPSGLHTITFSYIGYTTKKLQIDLTGAVSRNINLESSILQMDEVIIQGEKEDANVTDVSMSKNEISITQVKKLPALFGEPDLIKTIQMMPGVVSAGEGTSSFFVRGGSSDQNLILIDEAPIYDPSHLFGLFSVFNADVIKDSELYKGGIPSRYGGRLSSILDVRSKDGNNQHLEGAAGLGSIASRFMVEGPISKGNSSFILSGRRSYLDAFLKAAGEDGLVHFYDVNAKVNWRKNNENRVFASVYLGRDVFKSADLFSFGWGNKTATIRWNHLFNDKLFSNSTIIGSNFDYALEITDPLQGFEWTSHIQELTAKQDFGWFYSPTLTVEFGASSTYRSFAPGTIAPTGENANFEKLAQDQLYALDHSVYVEAQQQLSNKLNINYGLRYFLFQNIGEGDLVYYKDVNDNVNIERTGKEHFSAFETIKMYHGAEPRFSLRYMLGVTSSMKFSYNRMYQNTHLIASGTVPLPFNTWQPSGYYLKPQRSDQVALGYFRNFFKNELKSSIEAYYKYQKNITDFADNAQLFFNQDLPTEFRQGTAQSYGLETYLEKTKGKLTGFISYTLSKAERTIPGVNLSQSFLANYDRRHSFNILATYDLNERWVFGTNFTYGSGRPITLPSGRYEIEGQYYPDYISSRNGYQLPAYHRLDLSATLTPPRNERKKIKSSWVFSAFNVYSRKNPFSVYTQQKEDPEGNAIPNEKEARMIYLFPILPSVTYNMTF